MKEIASIKSIMRSKKLAEYSSRTILIFLLLIILSFSDINAKEKFLIIHLDGISSKSFHDELNEGKIPNISAFIRQGAIIPYCLSLFPGATEVIVPRLREGIDNSRGELIGWGNYYRDTGRRTGKPTVFVKLNQAMPRRSRISFLFGIPGLHYINGYALLNTAGLFELYDIVYYYWFSTDTLGHLLGKHYQFSDLERFDKFFGRLLKLLDEDINIIIYMDHGMSFEITDTLKPRDEIRRYIPEDKILAIITPNIYLKDSSIENKDRISLELIQKSRYDFIFYRIDEHTVKGFHKESAFFFSERDGKFAYHFTQKDVMGYSETGYRGEYLSADEWLGLTREHKFPGTAVNIFRYLQNPFTGDIVAVINPPVIPVDLHAVRAHHAGITDTDLLVPVMLKGPALRHLYDKEYLWLHTLFQKIPLLDFNDNVPEREMNQIAYSYSLRDDEDRNNIFLSMSPSYRWRFNASSAECNSFWIDRDIFSGYFLRLWLGSGIRRFESETGPILSLSCEFRIQKLSFNAYTFYPNEKSANIYSLSCRLSRNISLCWTFPKKIGISFVW